MKWLKATPEDSKKPDPSERGFFLFKTLQTPLLLIMALAILGTSWVTYQVHWRILQESLFAQAAQRAHSSRDVVQNRLNDQLESLLNHNRNLVGRFNIRQEILTLLALPAPSADEHLARQFDRQLYDFGLANIYLLDSRGHLRFTHGRTPAFNPDDLDIATALQGQESHRITREGLTWVLRSAVPVIDKGVASGALILTLELNLVLDELAHELKTKLALADSAGIQAQSNAPAAPPRVSADTVEQVMTRHDMRDIYDFEGKRLSHYMRLTLDEHDFVLVSEIGLGTTLQTLEVKKREIQQRTLLLLLVLLPITAFGIHLLLRPLERLRKSAREMAEQISGVSLQERGGHEIGRLVTTFDAMATALMDHEAARQKAEALLQQEHATLEVKVRDRTRDLERANDLLQREITERTRAQQKAVALQKFLGSLIDSMPSSLIGIDKNFRINQWNLEARKFTGLSLEEARGQQLYAILPQLRDISEQVQQTLENGNPNTLRHLNWPAGSNGRLVDVVVYPLSTKEHEGAVIRIDDVTERFHIEELMMQSEKMMSIGGLAAGMAHEINNPLASIIQGAQVIIQRLSPELSKNRKSAEALGVDLGLVNSYLTERQIRKMLNTILESGQRAGEIVNNMLSFTRGGDSIKSPQNIAELLDRAVDLATKDYDLKRKYDFHRIKIKRSYARNLPKIDVTPSQLQQVFFNLLQNAAQALSQGETGAGPPLIQLTISRQDRMLMVEVADNGPGITADNQKRVFEPFFTTKEVGLGTGLGLSVSYFIITENHAGRIELESAPGQGAAFRVYLPLPGTP